MDQPIASQALMKSQANTVLRGVPAILLVAIGVMAIVIPNFVGIGFDTYVSVLFATASFCFFVQSWIERKGFNSALHIPVLLLIIAMLVWADSRVNMSILGLFSGIFFCVNSVAIWAQAKDENKRVFVWFVASGAVSACVGALLILWWPLQTAIGTSLAFGLPFVAQGIALATKAYLPASAA